MLAVRRRRCCRDCGTRWTTYEISEPGDELVLLDTLRIAKRMVQLTQSQRQLIRQMVAELSPKETASETGAVPDA